MLVESLASPKHESTRRVQDEYGYGLGYPRDNTDIRPYLDHTYPVMIESLTRDVVALLMEERGLSMREAMDAFCSSRTFDALSKPETGLFFQSPAYILDEFKNEK